MNKALHERKLGVFDFLRMIYDGHPEYALFAVKAPIDRTAEAFVELHEAHQTIQWKQHAPIYTAADGLAEVDPKITLLQVKDTDWTVILRSLFYAYEELDEVLEDAKALSKMLKTKAITLLEEDTSGAIAYTLFENGDRLEHFEHAPGFDVRFESTLRLIPNIDLEADDAAYDGDRDYDVTTEPRNQVVDALFRELEIYLPACYLTKGTEEPALAVELDSEGTVDRADWILLDEDF